MSQILEKLFIPKDKKGPATRTPGAANGVTPAEIEGTETASLIIPDERANLLIIKANAQSNAQAENQATMALINLAKKAGELDYMADTKAQSQFDTFLNVALADPDNAGRSYPELLADAHANVLAYRGIVKAAGPAGAPAADHRRPGRARLSKPDGRH